VALAVDVSEQQGELQELLGGVESHLGGERRSDERREKIAFVRVASSLGTKVK
jgi:hypothetical protein